MCQGSQNNPGMGLFDPTSPPCQLFPGSKSGCGGQPGAALISWWNSVVGASSSELWSLRGPFHDLEGKWQTHFTMLFCPKAPGVEQCSCVTLGTRQSDSPAVLAAFLSPELSATLGSRCSPSIDFPFLLALGGRLKANSII